MRSQPAVLNLEILLVSRESLRAFAATPLIVSAPIRASARNASSSALYAQLCAAATALIFSVTRALDFQEDISADRGLLARAKSMQKGDKMSTEEYGALRRKVGGTKGGFFGESVDVKGKYVEAGYVDAESELVGDLAYAPFLGLVVFAVLATTVWVAAQVP